MDYESQEGIIQPSLQQNNQGLYGYTPRNNEYSVFDRSDFDLPFLGVLFHDPADVADEIL